MTGSGFRHVAALGSSFAAGPGVAPIVDRRANRSGRNYAHLVAERLGARLTDLTVSGATTTPGAELVSVVDHSSAHVLGSAQPWVQGFSVASAGAFHPNATGMAAVSDAIMNHLAADAPSASDD